MLDTMKESIDFILKRITELRLQVKGLSEKQLCRDLGKSPSYLSSMNNGANVPSTRVLISICDYFGITLSEFFSDSRKYPMLINEIIHNLDQCSEEELKVISANVDLIVSLKKGSEQGHII